MTPDTFTDASTTPVDVRLLISRGFAWTALGTMLLTIVAAVVARIPAYGQFFASPLVVILALALWVGVTVVVLRIFDRMQSFLPVVLFFGYPVLTGLCLPALFVGNSSSIVSSVFLCVTLLFIIMTIVSVVTNATLTEMRFYAYSAAFGAGVALLVQILALGGSALEVMLSLALVVGYAWCIFQQTDDIAAMARTQIDRIEDDAITLVRLPFRTAMRMMLCLMMMGGRASTRLYAQARARAASRGTPPSS